MMGDLHGWVEKMVRENITGVFSVLSENKLEEWKDSVLKRRYVWVYVF